MQKHHFVVTLAVFSPKSPVRGNSSQLPGEDLTTISPLMTFKAGGAPREILKSMNENKQNVFRSFFLFRSLTHEQIWAQRVLQFEMPGSGAIALDIFVAAIQHTQKLLVLYASFMYLHRLLPDQISSIHVFSVWVILGADFLIRRAFLCQREANVRMNARMVAQLVMNAAEPAAFATPRHCDSWDVVNCHELSLIALKFDQPV